MTCAGTSSGSGTGDVLGHLVAELEGGPVMIVGAFDVHRRQITYDWVDRATGEARRGQITPATREGLRSWLGELPPGGGHVAVEGCTGWRVVAAEPGGAGVAGPPGRAGGAPAGRRPRRGGGLHRLAVCGRGAGGGRVDRAPGRAGRHGHAAG